MNDDGDDAGDEFVLRNDPPRQRPQTFDNNRAAQQGVLFEGLDLQAGQQDLF
ncbi:MAG: hypothetical protein H0T51_11270 [Pirellulales bacterium]|nr:hypothetical protein [Pirellulales bacterium]